MEDYSSGYRKFSPKVFSVEVAIFLLIMMYADFSLARADTLYLKSGKKIEGKLLEKTDKYIKMELEGVPLTYFLEDVESISGEQVMVHDNNPDVAIEVKSKKGFFSELVSEAKTATSQGNLENELLIDLRKEFILPGSSEWFLTYYYRTKEAERIVPLLRAIVTDRTVYDNQERREKLVHFFACVLSENTELKDAVSALKSYYDNKENDFIGSIMQEAEDFKPAVPDSTYGLSRMWVEFHATGNTDVIKRIIGIFDLTEDEPHRKLKQAAQLSLAKNATRDLYVRDIINKFSFGMKDAAKKRIELVISLADSFIEASKASLDRGDNYRKFNKIEDALRGYNDALLYCADYAIAYNNISNILEERGEKEKSLIYLQAAVYMCPEYDDGYYNLGRHYFLSGLYDEAIKCYYKALEYNPRDARYNYAIAKAYQEKSDVEGAVKYFHNYLEYAPSGEFADLARNYLTSVGASAEDKTYNLFVMLEQKSYDDIEQYLEIALKAREKDETGYSILYNNFEQLIGQKDAKFTQEEILSLLTEWASQRPSSHFANTCLGRFYKNYAWQARGAGFSGTVIKEGAKLFEDRLKKAREYLETGYALNNNDPFAPSALIGVAMGLGLDKNYREKQFRRATKADNTDYIAYEAKLKYLMPKWYGSWKEMFSFARESVKNAPPNTLIPKVIIDAHWEMYYMTRDESYFKKQDVWLEVKNTYLQLLDSFPKSFELRNWFAMAAYLAGEYKIVKEQFDVIGNNWDKACWQNQKYFERVRNYVDSLAN